MFRTMGDPKLALEPIVLLEKLPKQLILHFTATNHEQTRMRKRKIDHQRSYTQTKRNLKCNVHTYHASKLKENLKKKTLSPKKETVPGKISSEGQNLRLESSKIKTSHDKCPLSGINQISPGKSENRSAQKFVRANSPVRLHKCSECHESFHTSTLLAVHKRIHDQESDEESDVDVGQEDIFNFPNGSREELNPPVVPNKSVPVKNCLKFKRKCFLPYTDTTTSHSGAKHSYPLKDSNLSHKLIECSECPASFSQQWYLDLHFILLHTMNQEMLPLHCPGCSLMCEKEQDLRKHVESHHSIDLRFMNNEISYSLGLPVDCLTGESIKARKKRAQNMTSSSHKFEETPLEFSREPSNILCDWQRASPPHKDLIIDLVEAELKYIVVERNKLGDHFSAYDIQRLSLEICNSLNVIHFFNGNPPKRWAQRVLAKVHQTPRVGRLRFVHEVNSSYVSATTKLMANGLTPDSIFYVFEAKLWEVRGNEIFLFPSLGTKKWAAYPEGPLNHSVGILMGFNAEGSKFVEPRLTYQGCMVHSHDLQTTKELNSYGPSKELVECNYFFSWMVSFLKAINTRPILLLVEGVVSQLSYATIRLAKDNDVHLLFLPRRTQFVHSHLLIMESVLTPLVNSFESDVKKYRASSLTNLPLCEFEKFYQRALEVTLQKAQIVNAFERSGFLPLPSSAEALEKATHAYLHNPDNDSVWRSNEPIPLSSIASDNCIIEVGKSPSLQTDIKQEPVDLNSEPKGQFSQCQFGKVKQELDECEATNIEIKAEPVEYSQPERVGALSEPLFGRIKDHFEESECSVCPTCLVSFSPSQPLTLHQCYKMPGDPCDPSSSEGQVVPFRCGDCGLGFMEKRLLKIHHCNVSVDEEFFTCPICESQFFDETALTKHKCHSTKPSNKYVGECDLFTCDHCGMSFALKDTLDFHLAMHVYSQGRPAAIKSTLQEPNTILESIISGKRVRQKPVKRRRAVKAFSKRVSFAHSSRAMSPDSDSSRTLTASPTERLWENDQGLDNTVIDASKTIKLHSTWQIPPPPLPEHDYLGQLYSVPSSIRIGKTKYQITNTTPAVEIIPGANGKPVRFNFVSMLAKIPEEFSGKQVKEFQQIQKISTN